jgi:hypothetical protein
MLNTSLWAAAAAAEITAAVLAAVVASAQAPDLPRPPKATGLPLEPEVLSITPTVGHKAGHRSSAPSPVRVAVAAARGMEQKEQAEMVVAVVAAGEIMPLKQAGPDRTASMAARTLGTEAIRSALAAVGQVKLAKPELLAA